MKVIKSLLKKSSLVLIFIILVIISCKTLTIWNIPEKEFLKSIESRNFDFLSKINTNHIDVSELESLGPGTVFYMSFVFEYLGSPKIQEKLLLHEIENGSDPWREEALFILSKYYLDKNEYKKAEKLISKNKRKIIKDVRVDRAYIEAIYWQHKDRNVLRFINRIDLKDLSNFESNELKLFRAVSSARLGRKNWKELFIELFSEQSNSSIHKRAWDFLNLKKNYIKEFSLYEVNLFKAQLFLSKNDYKKAAGYFEKYIKTSYDKVINPEVIDNSLKAFIYAPQKARRAKMLKDYFDNIKSIKQTGLKKDEFNELLFNLTYSSGKLYRKLLDYKNSRLVFEDSLEYSNKDSDRALWYFFDSSFRFSFSEGLSAIEKYSEGLSQPDYFSDLFETLSTLYILRNHYDNILNLYKKMLNPSFDGLFNNSVKAKYAYILKEANINSLVDKKDLGNTIETFRKTIEESDNFYYLSKIGSSKKPSYSNTVYYNTILAKKEKEEILQGLLKYGFYKDVYKEIRSDIYSYDPGFLKKVANELNKNGLYLESISIMGILRSFDSEVDFYKSDLRLLYPLAHETAIKTSAKKIDLDPYLLFALVRSESAFKANIVSRAGAIGLSQLMPATAKEEARRLGLRNPNLENPEDNTLIGANYLSRLIKRFGSVEKALAAYNAGPGRVRRWERKYSYIPESLFSEIIPYPETRNYVKNVIESSMYFMYLYENKK